MDRLRKVRCSTPGTFFAGGLTQPARARSGTSGAIEQIKPSAVTSKFSNEAGRVTPCAPFENLATDAGAHGGTRPTSTVDDVSKLRCRSTSHHKIFIRSYGERRRKKPVLPDTASFN